MKHRNRWSSRRSLGLLVPLLMVAWAWTAFGAPIVVNNHSFEEPELGAGGWTNDLPPSSPGDLQWVDPVDGNTGNRFVEFIGGFFSVGNQHIGTAGGHFLYQDLGVPYEPNTTYTLTVGVGYRNPNQSGSEAFTVIGLTSLEDGEVVEGATTNEALDNDSFLQANSTRVDSVPLNNAEQTTFTDVTLEFTTDDALPPGNIVIFLGDDEGGGRSHFDNVRLDAITALDPDGDQIPEEWETGTDRGVARGLDPAVDDGGEDPDGDTLTNFQEFELGSHPRLADTDGDGLNDNFETTTDPLNPDVDGDTLLDGEEIATHQTDPNDTDSDDDTFEDQAEVAAGTDPLDPNSKPSRGGAIRLGANFVGGSPDSDGASVNGRAGVVPQNNWNNFAGAAGTPAIANNSEGDPSLIRVSWETNGPGVAGDNPGNGDQRLMFGLLAPRGDGLPLDNPGDDVITEITVQNIAYPLYDLYVYFNSEEGGPGIFEANDQVINVEEVTPFDGDFVEVTEDGGAGNYYHFKNLTGSTLTILGRSEGVAGFQIEREKPADPSLLAIPEAVDFGVFEGDPGAQEATIRVLNPGETQTLNISNVEITGDAAENFSVTGVPDSLASGDGADVVVTFDPTDEVGIYRAFLEIESNDAVTGMSRIPLTGQIKHANGLLAHYKLDETEGTVLMDSSGNGYHGNYVTGSGSVTLGQPGLNDGTGTAVALAEGDDAAYAEVPEDIGFPVLAEGTYSFWVQQDAADVGSATVLFSRASSPANPYAVFFESTGGPDPVSWTSEATSETLLSEPFIEPGEVFHVLYTYSDADEDGVADVALYVNGELNASADGTSGYPLNTIAPFQIGATAGLFGLTGVIDDFQIYETILGEENIQYIYDNPGERALPPPPPPGPKLLGYWPADEGEGEVVGDASGNGLDGTLNEGSWAAGHTGAAGDNAFVVSGEDGGASFVEVPATGETFDAITVSGWVNGQSTGDWTGLFQSRGGADPPIGIGFRAGTGNLTYTWNDNNGNTWDFDSGLAIPADEWAFVALSLTPDAATLYLGAGGQLNSAVNGIPQIQQANLETPWFFGKDNCCGTTRNFQGAMDDVAIWNTALSEGQIASLFDGSASPLDIRFEPLPVVHYNFDEGSGTTIGNAGSGPAGELVNAHAGAWVASGGVGGSGYLNFTQDGATSADSQHVTTGLTAPDIPVSGEVDYTMAAWARYDTVAPGGDNDDGMIFGQLSEGNVLHNGARGAQYYMGHWGNDIGGGSVEVDVWHHVTFRYQEGVQSIFVDGQLVQSDPKGPLAEEAEIVIGATRGGQDRDFSGDLDDVRIYDLALSDEQIQSLATSAVPGGGGDGGGEGDEPGTLPADSVADFGGPDVDNGWSYGYRNVDLDNRTVDYDPVADFIQFPNDWWAGAFWDEPNADGDNVPWTEIRADSTHPNGDNNGELHWTIRRWTSPGGATDITWSVSKANVNCGNGVTGAVHVNGVRVDSETIAGDDGAGIERTITVDLEPGDVVDLVNSPFGVDDTDNDGCDGSNMAMSIRGMPPAISPNLVAHWPLDADGSDAVGGHDGTVGGGITFGAAGANGNTGTSAEFTGQGGIQAEWAEALNPDSFTFTAWVNISTTADWNSVVTSREDNGSTVNGLILYNSPDGQWDYWTGAGGATGAWQRSIGSDAVTNEWTHLAISYDRDSDTKILYVNGAVDAREEGQGYVPNGTTEEFQRPFNIGAGQDFGDGFFFSGLMDDVSMWNTALSADGVSAIMQDGVLAFATGGGGIVEPSGPTLGAVSRTADGNISIEIPDGVTYDIQYSVDLVNWEGIAADATGTFVDDDAGRTGGDGGYYRGLVK